MSSSLPSAAWRGNGAWRSVTLRLSLWYALLFTVSAGVLFGLSYFLLGAALERKDHEVIETRVRACAAIYDSGGVAALQEFVQRSRETDKANAFFVRVASPSGNAMLLDVPQDWVQFDPAALQPGGDPAHLVWLQIPKDQESDVTVASTRLADGSTLEVGRKTNNRDDHPAALPRELPGGHDARLVARRDRRRLVRASRHQTRAPGRRHGALHHRHGRPVGTRRGDLRTGRSRGIGEAIQPRARQEPGPDSRHARGAGQCRARSPDAARAPSKHRGDGVQTTSDPAAEEAFADCVEEADQVLTMLTALMDITEAESGVMHLNLEATSISELLDDVIDIYQLVAEEKLVGVAATLESPCTASVDRVRMRQVFANLLDNALKYTAEGGNVRISCRTDAERVIVIFEDNGMGISSEEQARIWGRLYRGDKSRSQRGLGLGLSLVKAIVEAHRGAVSVRARSGRGRPSPCRAMFTALKMFSSNFVSSAASGVPTRTTSLHTTR